MLFMVFMQQLWQGKTPLFTALLQQSYLPSTERKFLNCFREMLCVHPYKYLHMCRHAHMHTEIIFWQLREF